MGVRTVRLDDEAEKALEQITQLTGLSISGARKRGLLLLRDDLVQKAQRVPYDIYAELALGPGGMRQRHRPIPAVVCGRLSRGNWDGDSRRYGAVCGVV